MLKLLGGGTDLVKNPENESVASDTETITTNKTNNAEEATEKMTKENAVNNASGVMAENNAVQVVAKDAVKDAKIVKTVVAPSADKKAAGNVSGEKMYAQNADKNMTTQSFNVEKNKDVANANQLKVLKVDTQNTYAWDDTSDVAMIARGYHKTAAGWTKLQEGKDYNAVAKDANVTFEVDDSKNYSKATDNDLNWTNHNAGNPWLAVEFKPTISKSDLQKGKKILIGAVPVLSNFDSDSKNHFQADYLYGFDADFWTTDKGNDIYDSTNNRVLGHITASMSYHEIDFYFTVDSDDSYSNDATFDYRVDHAMRGGNTRLLPKTATTDNPLKAIYVIPNGNNLSLMYHFEQQTSTWKDNYTRPAHSETFGSIDMNWNAINMHFANGSFQRVFKLNPLINGDEFKPTVGSQSVSVDSYYSIFNPKGEKLQESFLDSEILPANIKSIQLADNLSAAELQKETPNQTVSYSKQSDGSYLMSVNIDDTARKLTTKHDMQYWLEVKNPNWQNGGWSDTEKQSILNATYNHYQKDNFEPDNIWLSTRFSYNKNKPFALQISDVTPDKQPLTGLASPATGTHTPDGLKSIDMSMYRTYKIQYKDEVTGKVVINDSVTKATNNAVDYTLQKGDYQLMPDVKVVVDGKSLTLDNGVLHFVIPQDEKKVPDTIVIPVLGREDYERDRTYTVVTQKPDHNGGTKDSTYATYTMKMTRNVTGRDGSDKVTFDNWQMTDGNGVTYTYDSANSVWVTSNGSKVTDIVLGATTNAPKDADFAVDGYTAHSDIAIDGIDLPSFADKLANPKDKIEITQKGQLLIHTSDFANPDKTLPSESFYIKYTANPQNVVYQFIDDDNNKQQVGSDIALSGVTDQTVATGLKVPANYYVASGASVPANYKFGATNQSPIEIHLKHILTDITDPARLHGESTRTFYVTYPNGRKPETIIQIVGVTRTGQHDTVTGQDSFTTWVLDSSASKVTVNGQDSTNYAAYDPASKSPRFASITLPRIPGYTAKIKQNPQNKMMYLVSFIAFPTPSTPNKGEGKDDDNKTTVDQGQTIVDNKGQDKIHDNGRGDVTIDVPSDNKNNSNETVIPSTPSIINTNDNKENNKDEHDWTINSIKSSDYVVSNGIDNYTLPMISNTGLSIIKTSGSTLAFTYITLNTPSDYVFTLTKRRNMYQLKVGKVINGRLTTIKTFKSRNYKDLMKELKKMYL